MEIAEIFGWLGGAAGTILLWPQVWRLWVGRKHRGLSITANTISVLYSSGWVYYGISLQSPAMIVTNSVALTAMVAILVGHVWLARPHPRRWLPTLLGGYTLLAGLALVIGPAAVGSVVGAGSILSIGTQVVALVRQRRAGDFDTSGVSRPRWWLGTFCNSMWAVFGILNLDPVMIVPASTNATLSATVLLLTLPQRSAQRVAEPTETAR